MDEVKCPKCGSSQISANKKGFNTGRAIAGGLISGNIWVAAAAGGIGMNELKLTCLACGHEWKIGRNTATQKEHEAFEKRVPRKDIPQSALYRCECGWQGTQQYGHAFCERCNKQLTDENIIQDFHAFEKKKSSSGCASLLLIPLFLSLFTALFISLVSCSGDKRTVVQESSITTAKQDPSIVGTWMKVYAGTYAGQVSFETYNEDGSFLLRQEIQEENNNKTLITKGKWELQGSDKVIIRTEEIFSGDKSLGESKMEVQNIITRLDADTMIYMSGGKLFKYSRVK